MRVTKIAADNVITKQKTNKVLENKMISTVVIFFTLVFSVVSNQWVRITLENISRENTRKSRTQIKLAKNQSVIKGTHFFNCEDLDRSVYHWYAYQML